MKYGKGRRRTLACSTSRVRVTLFRLISKSSSTKWVFNEGLDTRKGEAAVGAGQEKAKFVSHCKILLGPVRFCGALWGPVGFLCLRLGVSCYMVNVRKLSCPPAGWERNSTSPAKKGEHVKPRCIYTIEPSGCNAWQRDCNGRGPDGIE